MYLIKTETLMSFYLFIFSNDQSSNNILDVLCKK